MRVLKVLFVILVVVAGLAAYVVLDPYGPDSETFVDIAPGTGSAGIARELQQAGVIRSQLAFTALKLWKGGSLKAGEYRFDHPANMLEVYGRLHKGDVFTLTLIIPEGYNIFEIAQAVEAAGLGSREQFLAAEKQRTDLIRQWNPAAQTLEGFLFPATYKLSRHATREQILAAMVKQFGQEMVALGIPTTEVARTVTLASLVEKEVHLDSERPLVASVFENRLKAGMPLQTDPSVTYASLLRGTWTGVIHQSELHSDSEYNSYTHSGLPPGPICNPGLAALNAAMHPARTNYLYFVADAQGNATRFSETLQEHEANVAAYRSGSHP